MSSTSVATPPASSLLNRYQQWLLAAMLAFTLLRGTAWAFIIPPLDAPDEPSHLMVVAQMRTYHVLPVAHLLSPNAVSADSTPRPQWLLDYFSQPPRHFTRFRALPYESTQPPLYYLLCAALTLPLPDDPQTLLYACRLISVLLGTLTVFVASRAAATLAPGRPAFNLGVPLALTLWPQFAFQTATVTNDVAINLVGATIAWAWAVAMRQPEQRRWPLLLGAITALGLLTKLTMVSTLPGTALVLLGRARSGPRPVAGWLRETAIAAVVAAALIGPWMVRNLQTYGEPTGASPMVRVVHGIYLTRLGLTTSPFIIVPPLGDAIWRSFASFWAVFGWLTLFLPTALYIVAAIISLAAVGGAVAWAIRRWRSRESLPAAQFWTLAAYAATALAAIISFITYILTDDAAYQARYTFVALVPFTVIGVGGLLYATRSTNRNRLISAAALVALLALQVAAWLTIGHQLPSQ
jgi:Predicted membrane protein (DUF2142)